MSRKSRLSKPKRKPDALPTGVSGARFRKDPVFKNSRRAMAEFGIASRAATLIRREFMTMLEKAPQKDTHIQLNQKIVRLIRAEKTAGVQRIRINNLPWEKLREFEFNHETSLSTLLSSKFDITFDEQAARINILLKGINVSPGVNARKEITHMRVVAAAAAIDFSKETSVGDSTATPYIPNGKSFAEEIPLSLQLRPPLVHPVLVVLGFTIFQEIGQEKCELYNNRFRALSLIAVKPAPPPAYKTTQTKAILRVKKKSSPQKKGSIKKKK